MSKDLEGISKELEGIDVQNDADKDDYFEKVLASTDEPPTDEDEAGTDTSDKKVVDNPEDQKQQEADSAEVKALKDKIASLEKEAKGRLSDVVKSRQDKAAIRSELDELKSAVSSLLEKRNDALKEELEDKKAPLEDTKKVVEFGEDDSAYVDLSEVKDAIAAENAQTKAELAELKEERELARMKEEYDRNVQAIIGENKEMLEPAYDNLKDIYMSLNDKIIEIQNRTGYMGENNDGVLSQDEALELLADSPEEKAWLEDNPGIDPTRIARAFNSKIDLRTSLRHIAKVTKASKEPENKDTKLDTLDEKFKAAKQKPGSLGSAENQAGATGDLIDRIANLNFEDLESLSDAEAAKIEAMLLREELKGE